MARFLIVALAAVVFTAACACAWAVTWTKLGTSGFTYANPTAPGQMQNWQRIRFNSIAFDGQGNIYATACNGNNNGVSGGLTIFRPNGTKIADVDLNALGYPGAVTKLVTGGDGVVYALQNWLEINWSFAQNVNRILAILPNGSVVKVWDAGAQSDANRITGMTVGDDGNIYWTMNGADSYWKYHFFWRYDVASADVTDLLPGVNYGWSETSRMFNLEFLGASDDTYNFGVLYPASPTWTLTKLSATLGRSGITTGSCNPGWGRDWITATAYDPVNDILWVGGRGTGSGPWTWTAGTGASQSVANGELTVVKGTSTTGASAYYELANSLPETGTVFSIASRFKISSYADGYSGTILSIAAPGNEPWGRVAVSGSNYVLRDTAGTLATLGPVTPGQYNTVYVVVDCTTNKIECWWNGVKKYDGPAAVETYYAWTRAHFGAACRDYEINYNGSATIVFDWLAVDSARITPGDAMPTKLGYYLNCSALPTTYGGTNIMSYWQGSYDVGFFEPGWCFAWHTNGNDPYATNVSNGGAYWVQTIACNPADGEAWMAWNGEAGYSYDPMGVVWSRQAVNGGVSALGYEGQPEPGAQVVALGFNGGKAYAVTCNMSTGVYNVYYRTPGATAVSVSQAKESYSGTLVKTNAPKLVTYPGPSGMADYFYIEEEDRSSGIKVVPPPYSTVPKVGERAMVEGRVGVQNGEAVIFATSVVASSAGTDKIEPLAMTVSSVGGLKHGVQPATLSGGSSDYGFPMTLNTTGLLIRVAGKLVKTGVPGEYWVDDGSPYPLRIQFDSISGNNGDTIAVTGISGVSYDGWSGFRVIIPRDSSDIQVGF